MSGHPYAAAHLILQAKWFAIAKVGVALASLLTQLVLVRHLTVEDYASYTIFVAGTGVLVFMTMFGMDRVVYRFLPPMRERLHWREALLFMAALLTVRLLTMLVLLGILGAWSAWLLPDQLVAQWRGIGPQCALYALGQACTDSLMIFCNSLGLQRRQAMLYMLAGCVRLLAVSAVAARAPLDAADVADIFAVTELALAAALAAVLAGEYLRLQRAAPAHARWQWDCSVREICRDAAGTQAAYLLGMPFKGATLKLIVGSVAPPAITAAFGFFQTIADRAYQFMPVFLMKGILEPALAADYALRGQLNRIRSTVGILLRFNLVLACLGAAILLGVGQPLVDWITRQHYGNFSMLAVLIALQTAGMSLGESLFFALNPVGRIHHHNRLWLACALPFLCALGAAAWTRDVHVLVLASTLPYLVIYGWLRYVDREPVLSHGFGIGLNVLARLTSATVLAAIGGRAILLLPASSVTVLCATLSVALVFTVALRATGVFRSAEVSPISTLSPRLARLLRLVSHD